MDKSNTTEMIKEYVFRCFDDSEFPEEYPKYLESLRDFIRIPNLSPRFDPEWNTNGLQMKAWNHMKDFADSLDIIGYTSEIIKDEDKSPVLFMTVEPFNSESTKTILWYAHLDKQPWGEGWDEDRKPTDPILENGKLYGRGSSDDGYGMYAALWAIKACQDLNLSHPRMYVFIEAWEESDIFDLTHYIDYFIKEKFTHELDLVIALDSDTLTNQLFTVTWSLRGIINFDFKVEAFKDNIHSGNSGIYATLY